MPVAITGRPKPAWPKLTLALGVSSTCLSASSIAFCANKYAALEYQLWRWIENIPPMQSAFSSR